MTLRGVYHPQILGAQTHRLVTTRYFIATIHCLNPPVYIKLDSYAQLLSEYPCLSSTMATTTYVLSIITHYRIRNLLPIDLRFVFKVLNTENTYRPCTEPSSLFLPFNAFCAPHMHFLPYMSEYDQVSIVLTHCCEDYTHTTRSLHSFVQDAVTKESEGRYIDPVYTSKLHLLTATKWIKIFVSIRLLNFNNRSIAQGQASQVVIDIVPHYIYHPYSQLQMHIILKSVILGPDNGQCLELGNAPIPILYIRNQGQVHSSVDYAAYCTSIDITSWRHDAKSEPAFGSWSSVRAIPTMLN